MSQTTSDPEDYPTHTDLSQELPSASAANFHYTTEVVAEVKDLGTLKVRSRNSAVEAVIAFALLIACVALCVYGAHLLFTAYALSATLALSLEGGIAVVVLLAGWKAVTDWRKRR